MDQASPADQAEPADQASLEDQVARASLEDQAALVHWAAREVERQGLQEPASEQARVLEPVLSGPVYGALERVVFCHHHFLEFDF